jgi:hypothetical protein
MWGSSYKIEEMMKITQLRETMGFIPQDTILYE